jgi:hypothetical protein
MAKSPAKPKSSSPKKVGFEMKIKSPPVESGDPGQDLKSHPKFAKFKIGEQK